jgi:hypothetical protein
MIATTIMTATAITITISDAGKLLLNRDGERI